MQTLALCPTGIYTKLTDESSFWAQLPSALVTKTEGGEEVLTLAAGTHFPIKKMAKLLRRHWYDALWNRVQEALAAPNRVQRFLIIGTPGEFIRLRRLSDHHTK